jgi:3-hydroxypropanoate dehydrogenase
MFEKLGKLTLGRLSRTARTRNGRTDRPVTEDQLRERYNLVKFGLTSANCCPTRFVSVWSAGGKRKLAELAMPGNPERIRAAPVTVIIGHDLGFAEKIPTSFPARGEQPRQFFSEAQAAEVTVFRNASPQGADLILAARAPGLARGAMSGFSNDRVDQEFFANTRIKSNSIGYGSDQRLFPGNPRLSFEEAGRLA